MLSNVPKYRHGATGPDLQIVFTRDGAIVDLTGRTVTAYVSRAEAGATLLPKTVTVASPPTAGLGSITWATTDLVNTGVRTVGYDIEFDVVPPGEYNPDPARILVRPALT